MGHPMRLLKPLIFAALSVGLGLSQGNDCDTLDNCKAAVKANRRSSLIHFRLGEIYFAQHNYVDSANNFRVALAVDLDPKWTEVWSHIYLGKIFDVSKQRDRALNEYRLAIRTKDNTRGALDEARKYTETPYRPD
jgi:Tfp pilus assembly protein PilF